MSCTQTDLTIDTALADPVIAAVMRADRVDPRRFEALLRSKANVLVRSRDATPKPAGASELRWERSVGGAACAW